MRALRPSRGARDRARRSGTRTRSGRPGARAGAKVAFRPRPGTATPRQLGPTSRAPCARTSASRRSCRSRPSSPVSAKPAEITHRARTPWRSASDAASSTCSAGQADDGELDRVGDLADRRVGAYAGDGLPFEVDGERGADEIRFEDVAEELAADRAAPARRADHGDRRRRRRTGAARRRRRCGRVPRHAMRSAPVAATGKRKLDLAALALRA